MRRIFNIPRSLVSLRQALLDHPEYYILAKPTHWDKVSYLLDLLANNHIYNKTAVKDDYKQLSSKTLDALFGQRYYRLIQQMLTDHSIIESDGSYQADGFCKGWRLTESYRSEPVSCVFNQDSKFITKLENRHHLTDAHLYLRNQLRLTNINYEKAFAYLLPSLSDLLPSYVHTKSFKELQERVGEVSNQSLPFPLMCIQNDEVVVKHFNEVVSAIQCLNVTESQKEELQSKFISIFKIHTAQFFFTVDSKGRRVHTNITNLWSEFRQFLILDGEHNLVNTDIPTSQLVFACIPMLNYFYCKGSLPEDVSNWIAMVVSGQAYERLYELFYNRPLPGEVGSAEWTSERKLFKAEFFKKVYYCKRHLNKVYPESKMVGSHFPNVLAFIMEMKETAYQDFSIAMQQAESEMVIQQFGQQALTWLLPCLTIHDSVLVPAAKAWMVLEWFRNRFAELDLKVNIKPEFLTEESKTIHKSNYELF